MVPGFFFGDAPPVYSSRLRILWVIWVDTGVSFGEHIWKGVCVFGIKPLVCPRGDFIFILHTY